MVHEKLRRHAVESSSSLFLSDCCKSITIRATGYGAKKYWQHLGKYEATEDVELGAVVYRKIDDDSFFMSRYSKCGHTVGTWVASIGIPKTSSCGAIRSGDTAECPDSVSKWEFFLYTDWYLPDDDNITVQCSVHT